MKFTASVFLVLFLSLFAKAFGIQEGAVLGVRQLGEECLPHSGEAFSPAAAFFTLVMLGELATGETENVIQKITRAGQWKSEQKSAVRDAGGWVQLENVWWAGRLTEPSDWGRDLMHRYKCELAKAKQTRPEILGEVRKLIGDNPGSTGDISGVLLTQAAYAPRWKYAMRIAEGGWPGDPGRAMGVKCMQSRVMPIEIWGSGDDDDEVAFSIDLEGGAKMYISTGEQRWEGRGKAVEAIVFLPIVMILGEIDSRDVECLKGVAGGGANYGRAFEQDEGQLNNWIIRTRVDFRPYGESDWTEVSEKISQPVVLSVDKPFTYKIIGANQETIAQGMVSSAFKGDGL
jgi:hypothetical protein